MSKKDQKKVAEPKKVAKDTPSKGTKRTEKSPAAKPAKGK